MEVPEVQGMRPLLEVKRTGELGPVERAAIAAWRAAVFPRLGLVVAEPEWRVLQWTPERELACHVGVLRRAITVGGRPLEVGGVGYVGTRPEWRRRGMMRAGLARAGVLLRDELQVPFGLLVCGSGLVPSYEAAEWEVVGNELWFDQPGGSVKWEHTVMVLRVGRRAWPMGRIDLCGLLW